MGSKPSIFCKILTIALVLMLAVFLAANALAAPFKCKSVQASGGLRVRQEPDIESRVVYLLEDTETVIALFELGEWTLVAKNTGDHVPLGWACSAYLK